MDDRTYIRLHDGMPDHPKVVGLSHAAFRLYVECMCWSSRHLTDGVVPAAAMRRMGGWSRSAVQELSAASLLEGASGAAWSVHDYTRHQRTAVEVASRKEAKRSAGVTGNHERWHVGRKITDPTCELCAIGVTSQMRSNSDRKTYPKSSPETETETKKNNKTIGQTASDHDPDFTAFWAAWPRKVGKGHARKAWRTAVLSRRADPKDIIAAAEQFAAAIRAAGTEPQFIPHPATWLNGERYADEAAASVPGRAPGSPDDDDFWGR